MARKQNENPEAPSGELILPDMAEFQNVRPSANAQGVGAGRVVGLDYDAWAAALIDLNASPERVAAERNRLESKGYRKLGGKPIVGGYPNPEVWVIPRRLYEEARQERASRYKNLVATKLLPEFALARETVSS